MSRIGKKPISIVSGVKVNSSSVEGGTRVAVEGPKGKLDFDFRNEVSIAVEDTQVLVTRSDDEPFSRSYHGTARSLLANMVQGVSEGFTRKLEIIGVGYNAQVQGKKLVLQIGFCHPVEMAVPQGLDVEAPSPTNITINGIDKQLVGEFAAVVRRVRPPEPYKGKGIRYENEQVKLKVGKAFTSGE